MSDGEIMSFKEALKNREIIAEAIEEKSNCGWRAIACDVFWEGEYYCCQSGQRIETAY
jgi:hypothetical protein